MRVPMMTMSADSLDGHGTAVCEVAVGILELDGGVMDAELRPQGRVDVGQDATGF